MQVDKLYQEAQQLHRKGKVEQAKKRYERILQQQPDYGPARLFLALILQNMGKPQDAIEQAHQAIQNTKNPDAVLLCNYGVILKNAGQLEQAEEAYSRALELSPDSSNVKANLATLQFVTGKLSEAEKNFLELTREMEEAAPWLNLARISIKRDDWEQVSEYLQHAEDIDPTRPDLYLLKARLEAVQKDDKQAYAYLKKLFQREPAHPDAWLQLQGLEESVIETEFLRDLSNKLARMKVQSVTVLCTAVDLCRKNLIWDSLPKLEAMLADALEKPLDRVPSTTATFSLLAADVPQRAHLSAAILTWQAVTRNKRPFEPRSVSPRQEGQKIKVGFLSSDLRGHAVGRVIVGLLENLPKEHIVWYAYNNSFSDESDSRERIKDGFDRFINVAKLDDLELAQKIREDDVDVLIDLNGMTRETRVQVMAYRPAPIQMTWLGMPGSTGAKDDIDYLIGDPWITYEGNMDGFCEHVVRLPRSYMPCDHKPPDLNLAGTRQDHGLPEDKIVFCSFNQNYKLSPDAFSLWARVLQAVPDSVLWLPATSEKLHELRKQHMKDRGVDPDRLIMARFVSSHEEHVARISHADLILDSWPYNAHSTCVDALRAGVPVLTFPGRTFTSRVAAGILDTAGLNEWIASSHEEYVQKAVSFAHGSVQEKKRQVYERFWSSPIVDNQALGKHLEALCLGVYDRTAQGLEPGYLDLDQTGNLHQNQAPETVSAPEVSLSAPLETRSLNLRRGDKQARLHNLEVLHRDIIGLEHPPLVLDVGRFFPEKNLVERGLVEKISLEATAFGDGSQTTQYICQDKDLSSQLEPDTSWLNMFPLFSRWAQTVNTQSAWSKRLDDLERAREAAFLCLDARGLELLVLQNAQQVLSNVALIQVKAAPTPRYQGEASFFEIGSWLQTQGFILHHIPHINRRAYKPYGSDERPHEARNQIFSMDAVFIPDPRGFRGMDSKRLKTLAFLAHALYRSYDLSMLALSHSNNEELYSQYLEEAGIDA